MIYIYAGMKLFARNINIDIYKLIQKELSNQILNQIIQNPKNK